MNQDNTLTRNGIWQTSKVNMTEMILAILKENSKNVRMRGFTPDDLIETYEQSMEV